MISEILKNRLLLMDDVEIQSAQKKAHPIDYTDQPKISSPYSLIIRMDSQS